MAKVKQFEKVLKVLVDAKGTATKEFILTSLGKDIVANRIPTYIWEIKTKANVPIEVVKQGRKVVGYRIPDSKADVAASAVIAAEESADSAEEMVA